MPRTRLPLLIAALLVLTASGFGCKKQDSFRGYIIPHSFTGGQVTSTVVAPPKYVKDPNKPKDVELGTDPSIILLRQVMKNLVSSTAFRADMTIPTAEGTLKGNIEFSRGKGLHGVLHLPSQATTEIYLVGRDILFRSNTSTWTNLAGTPEGIRMASLFGSAFSLQGEGGTSTTISDSVRMKSVTDDPAGCKLYVFEQPIIRTELYETTKICVKDNLPQYIRVATANGDISVDYRDFNTSIDIVSPIKR